MASLAPVIPIRPEPAQEPIRLTAEQWEQFERDVAEFTAVAAAARARNAAPVTP